MASATPRSASHSSPYLDRGHPPVGRDTHRHPFSLTKQVAPFPSAWVSREVRERAAIFASWLATIARSLASSCWGDSWRVGAGADVGCGRAKFRLDMGSLPC